LLTFEQKQWSQGHVRVAGIDEAGRGPLAGPVVAAAVLFDRGFAERESLASLARLTDSKQLPESLREHFFDVLQASSAVEIGVGVADVAEIDKINILRATHSAMKRAAEALSPLPDHILVDGRPVPGLPSDSTSIVKGDSLSLSIAAASIIAKVTRDRMMKALDAVYPEYGFARHKGYGTQAHVQALLEHGPTPVHRTSFRPVREAADIRRRAAEGLGPRVVPKQDEFF
jgi:ribonuclease HII